MASNAPMASSVQPSRSQHPHSYVAKGARALAVMLAVAAAGPFSGSAFASTPAGTKTIPFTGQYTGTASLLIDNGVVTISSIKGKGKGSLVGNSSVLGSGSASSSAQCDPFGGTGSIAGASSKINFSVAKSTSQGCSNGQSGPVTVTFSGVAKALGGTGNASGAQGSLKFKGSLKLANTSGHQSGSFSVTLSGKLTVKG